MKKVSNRNKLKKMMIVNLKITSRSSHEHLPGSSDDESETRSNLQVSTETQRSIEEQIKPLVQVQQDMHKQLSALRMDMNRMRSAQEDSAGLAFKDWFVLIAILILHTVVFNWIGSKRN